MRKVFQAHLCLNNVFVMRLGEFLCNKLLTRRVAMCCHLSFSFLMEYGSNHVMVNHTNEIDFASTNNTNKKTDPFGSATDPFGSATDPLGLQNEPSWEKDAWEKDGGRLLSCHVQRLGPSCHRLGVCFAWWVFRFDWNCFEVGRVRRRAQVHRAGPPQAIRTTPKIWDFQIRCKKWLWCLHRPSYF